MSTRSYPNSSMTGEAAPGATPGVAASECAPQPWSSDTTRPSSGANSFAQTPNTRPSGPSRRTRKPQVIHGPGAACARGLRGPCSPEYQRSAVSSRPMADNTLERLGPGSVSYPGAGPAPDGRKPVTGRPVDRGQRGVPWGGVIPVEHAFVAFEHGLWDEPLVVVRGRQQVADAHVTGTDPVAPRHPVRREERVGARQQQALADRHRLGARSPRDRHCPPPPGVGRVQASEQVRGDAIAICLDAEMLADLTGSRDLDGCGPGQVDGGGAGLIDLAAGSGA